MQISFLLTRPAALKTMAVGMLSVLASMTDTTDPKDAVAGQHPLPLAVPGKSNAAHPPPPGVDYGENPTVFGKILRGELPANIVEETDDLLVFCDRRPRASFHHLIIPKRLIGSVYDLEPSDLPLLEEMKAIAVKHLELEQPTALEQGDYRLVFHVPPFNSVDHLHLHAIAPASELSLFHKYIKYKSESRSCVSYEMVHRRLNAGRPATPYGRPSDELRNFKQWLSSLAGL